MRWRRYLAGAAALAGVAAPFAGSPRARIDLAELARAVAAEEDHVSASELARWLRERRPGLRLIDVREASEYAAYHIPSAEHVPLAALAAARFAPDDTIVLYSERGVHAGQAWVFLRALGHRNVVFLRGGLEEWRDARAWSAERGRGC